MTETMCEVILLPHGRKVQAARGSRLIEVLIANSISLRSDCGGAGKCGKCLVELSMDGEEKSIVKACTYVLEQDVRIAIPNESLILSHIIDKPQARLPQSFLSAEQAGVKNQQLGIAIDLGTTTIALYLCDMGRRKIHSSMAVKNPQALYGDDVMSRISEIGTSVDKLIRLQQLAVGAMQWGIDKLLGHAGADVTALERMVVVGNPAMIHIFLAENPCSIGIAPYQPLFHKPRLTSAENLGFERIDAFVQTLPQASGFLGGDILASAVATELQDLKEGTLLVDLGTNGELILKGKGGLYATSCATGPAFEGASISCGMQAIPGAVNRVEINSMGDILQYFVIQKGIHNTTKPEGICGTGVISSVATLLRSGMLDSSGRIVENEKNCHIVKEDNEGRRVVIVPEDQAANGREVYLSQRDIRSVQLGKSALRTGIEFLLKEAGLTAPERIIIAGAFGTYLDKEDVLALGMIPQIEPHRIEMVGNAAGAGAIMMLCEARHLISADALADEICVVELAVNADFQTAFVGNLSF